MSKYTMAGSKRKVPERWAAGFTLLELTVALAIVAVVATAVFQLQDQGFRSFLRTRQITDAAMLAQNILVESQLGVPTSGRGRIKASTGEEFIWERVVRSTGFPGVLNVQVRIRLPRSTHPILEVTTYVATQAP